MKVSSMQPTFQVNIIGFKLGLFLIGLFFSNSNSKVTGNLFVLYVLGLPMEHVCIKKTP